MIIFPKFSELDPETPTKQSKQFFYIAGIGDIVSARENLREEQGGERLYQHPDKGFGSLGVAYDLCEVKY